MTELASSTGHRLSGSDRRALFGMLLGVFLGSLEAAIANTALPTIAASLKAPPAAIRSGSSTPTSWRWWPRCCPLPRWATAGRAPGVPGRAGVLHRASLLCVLAPSLPVLVAGRALQGIGAGALMSVNIALIRLIYPPVAPGPWRGAERAGGGLGFVSGPTIASLVLAVAPWPWLFAFNVPFGLLALALPGTRCRDSPPRGPRFDAVAAG
jgi:DHA2 family multidrug resistance protein-like MFS transporter